MSPRPLWCPRPRYPDTDGLVAAVARLVTDPDGDDWVVSARMHLTDPASETVAAETGDVVLRSVLLSISGALALLVVLSTPAGLALPGWLSGPLLVATGLVVFWWWARRPWSVTASPAHPASPVHPGEQDEPVLHRTVHGPWAARRTATAMAAELGDRGTQPERGTHPVRPLPDELPYRH